MKEVMKEIMTLHITEIITTSLHTLTQDMVMAHQPIKFTGDLTLVEIMDITMVTKAQILTDHQDIQQLVTIIMVQILTE